MAEFNKLDELRDEFGVLDKLNCKFDEFNELLVRCVG